MEQFRKMGEGLGSLKALMVFRDNIEINPRQCGLLFDICNSAYETIAEELTQSLKYEERHVKWKVMEQPFREICRILKEVEGYIRLCLEAKSDEGLMLWSKALHLHHNRDCVEFHIHNLISAMPAAIEAIEIAGEFAGSDQEDTHRKRKLVTSKYQKEWTDPKIFQLKFAKQYLVSNDLTSKLESAWNEDRWILLNKLKGKNSSSWSTKQDRQLADLIAKRLEGNWKLFPSSILVGSRDYQVKRRLGGGSQFKEIQWLGGESFAVRHFFIDNVDPLVPEISRLSSLSHPNILQLLCGFADADKKECFLVTELMSCRDIGSYIKEICGSRNKRLPFSLPVAIDVMLQIARGMEYLHSERIHHGNLEPSNILVKPRTSSPAAGEGYLLVKLTGFGLSSVRNNTRKKSSSSPKSDTLSPFIWSAPEVLDEQEQNDQKQEQQVSLTISREKADVYSFAMVCFEILTGKVPFEDSHLQGERMSRNIRAGERPLFPSQTPKFVANFTKRCWHHDPNCRPDFSSICRILRYTKKFLLLTNTTINNNPQQQLDAAALSTPILDYVETDSKLARRFQSNVDALVPVSEVPFQMFAYKVAEMEKTRPSKLKETTSESSGSDRASMSGDEATFVEVESFPSPIPSPDRNNSSSCSSSRRILSSSPEAAGYKRSPVSSKRASSDPWKTSPKHTGTPKGRGVRPPPLGHSGSGRNLRMNSESQLLNMMSPRVTRKTTTGHASDSELT
ncbi:unnamed protein product [Linum tenue]|uniref:Protein kinase domain-containing protein n=1 Tax=Linum tenue TaxID=586396 RepID=A0AAV0GRX7_9ROSI|nr:unnamed protein product [Linum tenue]